MPRFNSLTQRQAKFVDLYLLHMDAAKAARLAGYAERSAAQQGHANLKRPAVAEAIQQAMRERSQRVKVDADWVLARLANEAEADVADLYTETGSLKPVHEWPLIWRQGLVAGLEVKQEFEYVDGQKVPDGVVTKIRLSDRTRRLELIGKHIDVAAFEKDQGPPLPTSINLVINRPGGD